MSTSRRTFLITTGVAAAGTTVVTGAGPAAAPSALPSPTPRSGASAPTSSEPLVAYVSDLASGQVTVMRGDDEVVVTDRDLARRIAKAVR